EPAYFDHVLSAARTLMDDLGLTPAGFAAAVFHQPNATFPQKAALDLGCTRDQTRAGLLAPEIGNTYSGASPLGLTRALDEARPGDRLLIVSFGSGAGSDALSFLVTEKIETVRNRAPLTQVYLDRSVDVDYATYARWRNKILMH